MHRDIARRLERFSDDVAKGLSPRLMILMPPRHGKSELASRMFPAWHLGRYPDHEIISCAYNVSLAESFSRKVKEAIEDPSYQNVFDTRLHPDFRSNGEWAIAGARGGYVAAGVGGGITGKGAHCVIPYCTIDTPRGKIPASQIAVGDLVYGYNHVTGQVEETRVIAVHAGRAAKKAVRCGTTVLTADHRVFAGTEYVAAESSQGMSGLRLAEGNSRVVVQGLLFSEESRGDHDAGMRTLREDLRPGQGGAREINRSARRSGSPILRAGVLRRLQEGASGALQYVARRLRGLRQKAGGQRAEEVLLPLVLHDVPGGLSEYGELWGYVAGHESVGRRSGQGVPTVFGSQVTNGDPPRGSRPGKQRTDEPGAGVCTVPSAISCVRGTSAGQLAAALHEADYTVDIQTGTENFFAGGLLVHNCLIIDDPIKNAEEADSADVREKLWDWYGSTAYTRLAPGGGVLTIQTCWHDGDLAGKLQEAMRTDEESDQFEIVKYPAIAEHDEYADTASDLIVYDEMPDEGHLLRLKGEALHPERYDLVKLKRIKQTISPRFWAALYQQNPVPDDGAYFLKEHFRRGGVPRIKDANVFVAFDFAISEKKQNDYTVGVVGLQDSSDILHVADMVRFKSGDGMFIVEAILNLCQKWYTPSLVLGFEDGQIWRAIESLLRKRMRERKFYPSTVVLKPITDKMARARPLQGRMQQGMVSFSDTGDWYDGCRAEMLRFPAGVHDDQVDAVAWMTTMAVGRAAPNPPKEKPMKSWRSRLNGLSGLGDGGHMAA